MLRDQPAMVQGNIRGIIDAAERAGDQITSALIDKTESIRWGSRIGVALLLAGVIITGAGWH